ERCRHGSQAAADARSPSGAASNLSGLSLQEAQQILNISKLKPEMVTNKSMDGSFYLRSKDVGAKDSLNEELWIQAQEDNEKGQVLPKT
uniref:Uncharacterized protein n=1 Tax=Nannospalax galili TaxID=1026970 RepID=A0A8C6RSK6_NANGA